MVCLWTGFEEGDIIVSINDEEIDDLNELKRIMNIYIIGDKLTIKVIRDGKEETLKVELTSQDDTDDSDDEEDED